MLAKLIYELSVKEKENASILRREDFIAFNDVFFPLLLTLLNLKKGTKTEYFQNESAIQKCNHCAIYG